MKRMDHTEDVPSFAGVSLALYLLVSILSMMAAYEVGKVSDDVRNSVVVNLQSPYGSPNKSGDDGRQDPIIVPAIVLVTLEINPRLEHAAVYDFHLASIRRAFNARAPPAPVPPIA